MSPSRPGTTVGPSPRARSTPAWPRPGGPNRASTRSSRTCGARGSAYSDPGIPYVSYFNGGDALHGFLRAQYGFPQSDGCVDMPYAEAAAVWPYTPVGTVVDVSTS